MENILQLLTDPENQPHQFVGSPEDLRQLITQTLSHPQHEGAASGEVLADALRYVLSCRRDLKPDGSWSGWNLAAGSAPGNVPALNKAVPIIEAALTTPAQPQEIASKAVAWKEAKPDGMLDRKAAEKLIDMQAKCERLQADLDYALSTLTTAAQPKMPSDEAIHDWAKSKGTEIMQEYNESISEKWSERVAIRLANSLFNQFGCPALPSEDEAVEAMYNAYADTYWKAWENYLPMTANARTSLATKDSLTAAYRALTALMEGE